MIETLSIRNLALIEAAELEFSPGFNVITGESGAGKSILMGALALLAGERGDAAQIRTGAERAEVSARFRVPESLQKTLKTLLLDNDLDDGDALDLRRVITVSGSRNYVNGSPVPLKLMHTVAGLLVDMQKADDQLSLGSCARQLELLDGFAGTSAARALCAERFAAICVLEREKAAFSATLLSGAELELAEELVAAVSAVNPREGEDEELSAQQRKSGAAAELLGYAQNLENLLLDGEGTLSDRCAELNRMLAQMAHYDGKGMEELVKSGDLLSEQVRELACSVERYASGIELDSEAFAALEERLSAIQTLKRRYGPGLEQVMERWRESARLVEETRGAASRLREFDAKIAAAEAALGSACAALTELRRAGAAKLASELKTPLRAVGFEKGRFEIAFSACQPGANGADALDFLFSANLGEDLRPLRLIASSGERSRLFLALKTVLADADGTPSAVFDEIDVNIGGETANKVGALLRGLGKKRQVICISHLAQVAAGADRHFAVAKHEKNGRTVSTSRALRAEEIVGELARMLGGGAGALEHASQILKRNSGGAA